MKRSVLSITLLLCTAALLAACGSDSNTQKQTEAPQQTESGGNTETRPINEDTVLDQIGDIDLGGYEFRIASRDAGGDFYSFMGNEANELYFEEETGDVLYDAIYTRNRRTEELLNITIKPIWMTESADTMTTTMENNILAGDDFADAAINRLDFTMNSAAKGMLYNVYDISTIHMENSWWDQTIVSNFTMFSDQLYALCGDIVFFDDFAVQALFGNTRIMTQYDIEVPYQDVRDGTWTFDKFAEMAKQGFADLNGDSKITREDDQLGYGNHEGAILHMIYCFGERLSETQPDGSIIVNYGNEGIVNTIQLLTDFLDECENSIGDSNPDLFKKGTVMFFPEMIGGISALRDMEDDYCVLPMPKGDASQDGYTAYVSNGWSTCYSIPTTVEDPERIGTVLEVMSAISADTVTPALYDIMLNQKYVRNEESQEMLSYIWASKAYDLAGDLAWADDLRTVYYNIATSGKNNFASTMEKRIKKINAKLTEFLDSFAE